MYKALALVAALSIAPAAAQAASPRDGLLVSPTWLAAHATDKNLVILQAGDLAEYQAKHVPGARFVAQDALSVTGPAPGNLVLEMPAPEDLRARLEKLGVSNDSKVVVVYGKDRLPAATRVLFTLETAGLKAPVLLDGGLVEWERSGHATTDAAASAEPGKLAPLKIRSRIVDAAFVDAHRNKPGFKVIDARAATFYDGSQAGGSRAQPQPAGHIAGAASVPFTTVMTPNATIKSADELMAMFRAAGVKPGDEVITYCHVGQQASAVAFAAETLGIMVLLYDGSYQDWSQRSLAVEGPVAAK
jgi:thiosulfate/3-mercaptopyruvate sulfurtransferase